MNNFLCQSANVNVFDALENAFMTDKTGSQAIFKADFVKL